MIKAQDIRKGLVVRMDGQLFVVTEFQHRTPGNLRAFIQAKFKALKGTASREMRLSSGDMLDVAFLDKRPCQYSYKDGTKYVFMDKENYEQYFIDEDFARDAMAYVVPDAEATVTFHEGNPVSIELPSAVALTVIDTEMGVKGNTVTNVFKPAKLETGLEIKVPMFIQKGERVKVSTETGEYLDRAK